MVRVSIVPASVVPRACNAWSTVWSSIVALRGTAAPSVSPVVCAPSHDSWESCFNFSKTLSTSAILSWCYPVTACFPSLASLLVIFPITVSCRGDSWTPSLAWCVPLLSAVLGPPGMGWLAVGSGGSGMRLRQGGDPVLSVNVKAEDID